MLVLIGLTHRHAPVELRERCAVPAQDRERARAELRRRFGHAVLLATCGRTELYIDAPDPDAAEAAALTWMARFGRLDEELVRAHAQLARGADAIRHAVRVACGLESAVEGEDEILGQVRRAWLDASAARALSPALDAVFRIAARTGRQARRIGEPRDWTSLGDTAAAHVALAVQHLAVPRVLIAGTGPMGVRAARTLHGRFGADLDLALLGRTPEHVRPRAAEFDARPLLLDDLPTALNEADAAIVALRSPRALVCADVILPRPPHRPLLIVDLSMPRAVDGAAASVAGVRLIDVDGVTAGEGRPSRWDAAERVRVERLVDEAVRELATREVQSDAAATLAALRMEADGIRRTLLARTLRRLPDLDAEARWAIDALSRALVNRVLHEPTLRLRADADDSVAPLVRDLFGMRDASDVLELVHAAPERG